MRNSRNEREETGTAETKSGLSECEFRLEIQRFPVRTSGDCPPRIYYPSQYATIKLAISCVRCKHDRPNCR